MPNDPSDLNVVQEYESRMVAGDVEGAIALLHEDFVMIEPESLPYAGTFVGRDGFRAFRAIFTSVWIDVDRGTWSYFVGPHGIARRAHIAATSIATGRQVEWEHAEFFSTHDGRIATLHVFYFDTAAIAAAIAHPIPG